MATGLIPQKDRTQPPTVTKKRLMFAVIFGVIFTIIDIILVIVDPVLIIAKYCVRIDYGTYIYEALEKEADGVYISTYLFNVTNADRFQKGLDNTLKVEEVGPFTYEETRTNDELELDFKSNVIRYSPRIRTTFVPEMSVARPEDVHVTMPNMAMLAMASKMSTYGFLPQVAYNLLTHKLKSKAIVHMSAKDYLWGYDEPLIRLGHDFLPGYVNFDVLGVLDRLYDKKAKYLLELSADNEDKFSIRTVNGVKGLEKWGYNDPEKRTICNSFTNTYEGICYPTEMTKDRKIRIYRGILCRILELDYHGTLMTPYAVEGLEYRVSNRTYSSNEETKCLCNAGNCVEGVSDISPCFLGLPVVLSNAHFLYADPKLYEKLEGIRPNETKHGSSFVIEPKIGMVLDTQFSVQVNLLMRDVRFNSQASRFSDMLVPVVYFKVIQRPLDSERISDLHLLYFIGPNLVLSVQVLFAALALGLLGYAAGHIYYTWIMGRNKQIIMPPVDVIRDNGCVEMPLMR